MKKVILNAVLAAMVLSFAGCGEETKTVEYYNKHTDERDAKISECMNNPGGHKGDANCVNAAQAKLHSGIPVEPGKSPDGKIYQQYH